MSNLVVEVSNLPNCDLCQSMRNVISVAEYDGATVYGPWANMCADCFASYGIGLGTGRGQRLIAKPHPIPPDFQTTIIDTLAGFDAPMGDQAEACEPETADEIRAGWINKHRGE